MTKIRCKTIEGLMIIGLTLATALTGCAEASPISEKNEELVAEYAAGVLMRYSASKTGQGLEDYDASKKEDELKMQPSENEEYTNDEDVTDHSDETPMVEAQGVESTAGGIESSKNLADMIGISGFDVLYRGFEVKDIYPDDDSQVMTFAMQAAPGKELLILHFDVTNNGTEAKKCDVLSRNVKFRVLLNNETRVNEQMTILLNDLKSFNDTVEANSTVDTVLVFETDKGAAGSMNGLSLIVVGAAGEDSLTLQ